MAERAFGQQLLKVFGRLYGMFTGVGSATGFQQWVHRIKSAPIAVDQLMQIFLSAHFIRRTRSGSDPCERTLTLLSLQHDLWLSCVH